MSRADWNNAWQNRISAQNFSKKFNFLTTEDDVLWVSYKIKIWRKNNFYILKFIEEMSRIWSGSRSGCNSQRYGSGVRIRTKMSRIPNTGRYCGLYRPFWHNSELELWACDWLSSKTQRTAAGGDLQLLRQNIQEQTVTRAAHQIQINGV